MKLWFKLYLPYIYFCLTIVIGAILRRLLNIGITSVDPISFVLSLWLGYKAVGFSYICYKADKKVPFYIIGSFLWFLTFGNLFYSITY